MFSGGQAYHFYRKVHYQNPDTIEGLKCCKSKLVQAKAFADAEYSAAMAN